MIELSTVVVLLALFAATVAPHMASAIEGSKRRQYRVSVLTLLRQAKNEAVLRGQATEVRLEESTFRLVATSQDQEETSINVVQAVEGVEATHTWVDGAEVSEGEWALTFFPDGTSNGGGFQFDEGTGSQSVTVSRRNGLASLGDDVANPTLDQETEWEAGTYVQNEG